MESQMTAGEFLTDVYVEPQYKEDYVRRRDRHPLYQGHNCYLCDRDAIQYSNHFRRLAGVTQVAGAFEPYRLNNRYTHSVSVALAGRLLVEKFALDADTLEQLKTHGFTSTPVVEAACLAHDLGHPPFGHVGEEALRKLCEDSGARNGFEGNAQSFRIVTRLEIVAGSPGMKLTRATLRAILKYPWTRSGSGKKNRKWGVYREDEGAFRFAFEDYPDGTTPRRSIEAEIMDWSDDAAYAIDDMVDFYTSGLIPLDRLAIQSTGERARFLTQFCDRQSISDAAKQTEYETAFNSLCNKYFFEMNITAPYSGEIEQQGALSDLIFNLHNDLREATTLSEDYTTTSQEPRLKWNDNQEVKEIELELLKGLTVEYVISSANLLGQQEGYQTAIEKLFEVFANAAHGSPANWRFLPVRYQEMLKLLDKEYGYLVCSDLLTRAAADMICDLTDIEALNYYQRITGIRPGSVFLPPIR